MPWPRRLPWPGAWRGVRPEALRMTGGERRFDVLALGEPTVEFNQRDAGGSTYLRGFGGDTSNAAIAAARQGARAAYASAVGDDAFGRALLALWDAEGVNSDAVQVNAQAHTGVYFVSHGLAGHKLRTGRSNALFPFPWHPEHDRTRHLARLNLPSKAAAVCWALTAPPKIVLLRRLLRVIPGRQPAFIGPANPRTQPNPAARGAGSHEPSRLGNVECDHPIRWTAVRV